MPEEVVLVSGVRTPAGKFGREFKDVPAQELGAKVIKEAVNRACIQMHAIYGGHPIGCSGARILLTLLYAMIVER